jgi:hypothetical protein
MSRCTNLVKKRLEAIWETLMNFNIMKIIKATRSLMKDINYIHQDANNKIWKRPHKELKFSKF